MSRIGQVSVLLLGSAMVATGIWYGISQLPRSAPALPTKPAVSPRDLPAPEAVSPETAAPGPKPTLEDSQIADFSATFRKAENYRQFIVDALPAARNGNADAQYYISAAMKYCADIRGYFGGRNKMISLEAAIERWASTQARGMGDFLQRAESLCRDFWDNPDTSWGSVDEWQTRAAESGQPVAKVLKAQQILLQKRSAGQQKMTHVSNPDDPSTWQSYQLTEDDLREPRALVTEALVTRNPEAIAHIGDLAYLLNPDRPDVDEGGESWVWLYAACLRGLDCSGQAEWRRQICGFEPDCSPQQEGLDFLRQLAPRLDLMNLEARAYALNDRIDQAQWNALGLGL